MDGYTLKLLNVHCASCVQKIEEALSEHLNAENFDVNFADRRIEVKSDIKPSVLIGSLVNIGYEAKVIDEQVEDDYDEEVEVNKLFKQAFVAGVLGFFMFIVGMSAFNCSGTVILAS